ncbi:MULTISPECIES: tetratricopeptide repeat protein [unclassified Bilifractor]|uniref:tetratricopeptide repeat protein n=1 Tax=unclassified Bilifractor TaxID=2815795 RepID=UPI003F8FF9EF
MIKDKKSEKSFRKARISLPVLLLGAVLLFPGCGNASDSAYASGMSALKSEDYNTAITNFQSAVDSEGREAEGYRGLGIAYLNLGDYENAVNAFSKSLAAIKYPRQNKSFREDVLFYQAQAYVEEQQYDNAMTIYNELIQSEEHAGQAFLLRGKLYALENKFGQAGQDFQKALELDNSYEIYLEIYDIYVQNNRQADGAAFLKDALNQKPSGSDDYYQLGRICYELKDYGKAEKYLKKAIEKNIPGAVMLLGRVYSDTGDYDSAEDLYQSCIDNDTSVSLGYNGLALIAIMKGNYDDALQKIQAGLDTDEAEYKEELLYNEIIAYEKKLDFKTAASKMESFLKSYPTNQKAVQENLFLQSRVTETEATASENVTSSSGSSSSPSDVSNTQSEASGSTQSKTTDTADTDQSNASYNSAGEGQSNGDDSGSYQGTVDADNDGYDDNTGVYYGTVYGTDTSTYGNYDSAGYYDGSTGY